MNYCCSAYPPHTRDLLLHAQFLYAFIISYRYIYTYNNRHGIGANEHASVVAMLGSQRNCERHRSLNYNGTDSYIMPYLFRDYYEKITFVLCCMRNIYVHSSAHKCRLMMMLRACVSALPSAHLCAAVCCAQNPSSTQCK